MSKKITKELQEAIFRMPEVEKDKLLLHLIAKEGMLIKKFIINFWKMKMLPSKSEKGCIKELAMLMK